MLFTCIVPKVLTEITLRDVLPFLLDSFSAFFLFVSSILFFLLLPSLQAVWAAVLVSRHVIPRLLRRLFMPQDQSPSSSSSSLSNCAQSSQFVPSSPHSWSSPAGEKHRNLQYEVASHGKKKKSPGGLGAKAGNMIECGARKSQPLLDSFDAVAAVEVASSHYHEDDDDDSHHPNKSSSHLSHTGDGKDSSENSGDDDENERPLSPESTLLLDTMGSSNGTASSSSSSSSTSGFSRRASSGPHNSSSSSGMNVSGGNKNNNNNSGKSSSSKCSDNGSSSSSSGSASHTLRAPPELLTLLVVVYCLSMALLSEYMNLSYSSGALVAGLLWQGNLPDGLGLQAHVSMGAWLCCSYSNDIVACI